jgi:hypothetical protein
MLHSLLIPILMKLINLALADRTLPSGDRFTGSSNYDTEIMAITRVEQLPVGLNFLK